MTSITFEDYCKLDAVNWSSLKHLRESPLKYRHMRQAEDEDNIARAIGRATHYALFEPQEFERAFFVLPTDAPRRPSSVQRNAKKPSPETIEAIRWWDEFNAAAAGRTMLTDEQMDQSTAIANAVRNNPVAAKYLDGGLFEQALTWEDQETGLPCKARTDLIVPRTKVLADLKTTGTIEDFRFGRVAARMGYHCQLAHYRNGVYSALGWQPKKVVLIVVESAAPHDVAVFVASDMDLLTGENEVRSLLIKLKGCLESDRWPGRYEEETPLVLPNYVFDEEEMTQ